MGRQTDSYSPQLFPLYTLPLGFLFYLSGCQEREKREGKRGWEPGNGVRGHDNRLSGAVLGCQ